MFADFIFPFIKKILPWTLLIMLVTVGVTYITFTWNNVSATGQIADTYMYKYTIDGLVFYEYRFDEYVRNLNIQDIFGSWEKITLQFKSTWIEMEQNFNWDDKPFRSLANQIIMIPNMLINVINILVVAPTQLITQILMLVLRILGMNVSENSRFWLSQFVYKFSTINGIPQIPFIKV